MWVLNTKTSYRYRLVAGCTNSSPSRGAQFRMGFFASTQLLRLVALTGSTPPLSSAALVGSGKPRSWCDGQLSLHTAQLTVARKS